MLINAAYAEESRVAIVEDKNLIDFEVETPLKTQLRGNIYKAIVAKVEPSLGAAFVDFGASRHGFLPLTDVGPDILTGATEVEPPKRGKEILVQVMRDEIGTKGALVSTFYSLAGRYVVFMPNGETGGISRKIDDEQRSRLREVLQQMQIPEGMGVIVRTAGIDRTKVELAHDINYLRRLWDSILDEAKRVRAPKLVYQEEDVAIRAVRDYFSPDVVEILVDDNFVFERVKTFMAHVMPKYQDLVKPYTGKRPIFDEFGVEAQIATIYERRVPLPSGGSIVLDRTEALIAIDVNSGKATQEKGIEDTAFRTNVEAAHETARQVRLRDWGGLVVIDFIDMRERKNIREVERALKDAVRVDKARVKMTHISEFGLLQMSRQRLRPPVVEGLFQQCGRCDGRGLLRTPEAATVRILRAVHGRVADGSIAAVRVTAHQDIVVYLLNKKRKDLARLEREFVCAISVEVKSDASPDFHAVEYRAKTEEEKAIAWAQRVSREKRQDFEEFVESQEPARVADAALPAVPDAATVGRSFDAVSGELNREPELATGGSDGATPGTFFREEWHDEIPIEVDPALLDEAVDDDQSHEEASEQRPPLHGRARAANRGEASARDRERRDRDREREPARATPPEVKKPWSGGGRDTNLLFPQPPYDPSLHFGIPEWGRELTLAPDEGRSRGGGPAQNGVGREDDGDGGSRRRRRRGGRGRRRPSPPAP